MVGVIWVFQTCPQIPVRLRWYWCAEFKRRKYGRNMCIQIIISVLNYNCFHWVANVTRLALFIVATIFVLWIFPFKNQSNNKQKWIWIIFLTKPDKYLEGQHWCKIKRDKPRQYELASVYLWVIYKETIND